MIERIGLEVHDVLASEERAIIFGELASRIKSTGKTVEQAYAIVLTIAGDEITASSCSKKALQRLTLHAPDTSENLNRADVGSRAERCEAYRRRGLGGIASTARSIMASPVTGLF
jgi:hypothetical protein